jgi:hypothetical protein
MGQGMDVVHLSVAPADVVFVKGILEASDGLAGLFAERGGELSIVAPTGRRAELDELLEDLRAEVGGGAASAIADIVPDDGPAR